MASAEPQSEWIAPKAFADELTRREQLLERGLRPVSQQTISRAIARIPGAEDRGRGAYPRYRLPESSIDWVQEHMRCSRPDCDELAPGPSGRCGRHPAKVLDEPAERFCEHCGDSLGLVPASRIKLERGKFCSTCWPVVRDGRLAAMAPTANPNGAREHHARISDELRALEEREDLFTFSRASETFGVAPHTLWVYLAREVRTFGGSRRAIVKGADVRALLRELRASGALDRLNDPDVIVARLRGRGVVRTNAHAIGLVAELRQRDATLRLHLAPGRAPNEALRSRLEARIAEAAALELEAQAEPDLNRSHVILAAVDCDRDEHPHEWPADRYGEMRAPYERKRVVARVLSLVKPDEVDALIERERIRATLNPA